MAEVAGTMGILRYLFRSLCDVQGLDSTSASGPAELETTWLES